MDKSFNQLKRQEKEAFFMFLIITEIKRLGGQATINELKKSIIANCNNIPENVFTVSRISKNGNLYCENMFPFNFAVTNLVMADYLDRPKNGQLVLTEKGRQFNGNAQELADNVYKLSLPIWTERSKINKQRKDKKQLEKEVDIDNKEADIDNSEEWRTKLLIALENLTPAKFELFCRALVKKMNVDINEQIGVKLSGDGGIDGYGYMTTDDFRTTRVAIQAKKWKIDHFISSPEIDKFRGAMDKYRAEYGIFITTSSYTREAIRASRNGTRVITLIDGIHLTNLIAKYELYVKPITTYELDDFFNEEN